jgi:hypothetical protein
VFFGVNGDPSEKLNRSVYDIARHASQVSNADPLSSTVIRRGVYFEIII